jgi:DNA polymerase-3 subunit alpha (Gram-positive type)
MATARKAKVKNERAFEMNEILLCSDTFVVGDIETTGLSPAKGGRIIEVAGVKIENGKIVDTFNQLINPEQKVYPKTTELTGITNEMVVGKPVFGQVLPEFYRFIGDAVFVAHNASFDWDRYLKPYFNKVGIIATNPVICTKVLSKLYIPSLPANSLLDLCEEAGVEIGNHHRALDDSIALAHVFIKYMNSHASMHSKSGEKVVAPIQVDLFLNPESENQVESEKKSDLVIPETFKIKRVSYWEKDLTKQKKMQRIYVLMSTGSVYFDIPAKAWYNKDVKGSVDFHEVNQRVLNYLNINNNDELCQFRSIK